MIADSRANNPSAASADPSEFALGKLGDETPRVSPALDALPNAAAVAVTSLGLAVLLGWLLDIQALKSVFPELETMKPITALGFILAGITLYLNGPKFLSYRAHRIRSSLSLMILLIPIITLIATWLPANLNIGDILVATGWSAEAAKPMSLVSAVEFTLFGAAMLVPRHSRRNDHAFVALTFVGMLIALLVSAGYLYNLPILYQPVAASSIALHTAIAFFVLFVAAAMTRPHTGWVALLSPGLRSPERSHHGFCPQSLFCQLDSVGHLISSQEVRSLRPSWVSMSLRCRASCFW